MSIYTCTGDDGTTALYKEKRCSKADIQMDACGCVDELASVLGILLHYVNDAKEQLFIEDIQRDLYSIMSFLANAPTDLSKQEKKIGLFEKKIDSLSTSLPQLKTFILPRGSVTSCWAHIARTVCRRSERAIVLFLTQKQIEKKRNANITLKYINRLSDLLFTYARVFNKNKEIFVKNE